MYRVRAELTCRNVLQSVHEMRIGLRTLELDTNTDASGQAFAFKVNGQNVFMKGCNIVPPEMVPSQDADRKWVELVKHMSDAGMNMARVWASGIYPPDAIFDACDTAGILVWQDHMFAQLFPATPHQLANAQFEAAQQAIRLDHHPSLVIWCGNNELDVAWRHWGWQQRYGIHGADSVRVADDYWKMFSAKDGYLAPFLQHIYTPTSPLSNWGIADGLKCGDLHYWGVWHGDSAFSSFKNKVAVRSEYGFRAIRIEPAGEVQRPERTLPRIAYRSACNELQKRQADMDAIEREPGGSGPPRSAVSSRPARGAAKAWALTPMPYRGAPHVGHLIWQLNDCWTGPR